MEKMNFLDRILYPGIENMSENGIPERALVPDIEHLPKEQRCYFMPYEWAADGLKGKSVLDICCGIGSGTAYFAKSARRITGIDNSKVAIRYARNHYEKRGCTFEEMDVLNLKYHRESIEAVTLFEALEHFDADNQSILLWGIGRLLKPNGSVYFSTPNKQLSTGNNIYHLCELDPEELRWLMSEWFRDVVVKGITFDGEMRDEPDGCPILVGSCRK